MISSHILSEIGFLFYTSALFPFLSDQMESSSRESFGSNESLEKLKSSSKIFSQFEVNSGNEIYLYWISMFSQQEIMFQLHFIAKFKGSFTAKASCAYEYYCPENKKWVVAKTVPNNITYTIYIYIYTYI